MCVQSIKRPDVIQMALQYRCTGRFSYVRRDLVSVREYRERVSVISYPALWPRNDSNQFGGS